MAAWEVPAVAMITNAKVAKTIVLLFVNLIEVLSWTVRDDFFASQQGALRECERSTHRCKNLLDTKVLARLVFTFNTGPPERSSERRLHPARENLFHLAVQSQRNALLVIVIGRAAIDDEVRHASSRRDERKGSGGIDR